MLVICNSISGQDIPEKQRFAGESSEADYSPLIVGEKYVVFAIIFYKNRIDYLISPCSSFLIWVPSCLFSIIDKKLGDNFYASKIDEESVFSWLYNTYEANYIIGYKKITESFDHFVGIIERNEADLVEFSSQKSLIY